MRTPLRILGATAAVSLAAVAVPLLSSSQAQAVKFTGGNLVVYRVGDGATALSNAAAPVFLDEFTPDANLNALTVQGGQLFASGILTNRLAEVGTGTPKTSATLTDLTGLPDNLLTYGYALLDLTSADFAGTGLDTLYVANSSERGGTLDKYRYDGSTWTSAGYVDVEGATGLVADIDGGQVSLAVTTPTQLLLLTDPSGAGTTFTRATRSARTAPRRTVMAAPTAPVTGPAARTAAPAAPVAPARREVPGEAAATRQGPSIR